MQKKFNKDNSKQICVQLSTDAKNVALPAFARCMPLLQQSIDISCPPDPRQQTRRTLLQPANGTDGRTDGHRTVSWTLLSILCRHCQ